MLYLATWPVLFAILNCLGQMFAARAAATKVIGYGEGLNLLTQTGLADVAQTAYMTVMGMQLSVPFLAWTLLWGGGYAFSQMASSFTQGAEGFAGKTGAETVDGNVAFDTQSLHTRSIANTQMAQQQLGASFNYGSRFDDGKLATLHGPNGQVTMQEHQTQLGTNVSQNDTLSTMMGMQSQIAAQSAFNSSRRSGLQVQEGLSNLYSVGKTFADNKGWTETFGNSESSQAQKSLNASMDMVERFAKDHSIAEDKAASILLQAGGSLGIGSGKGGVFASVSGAAKANWNISAADKELISKAQSDGTAKAFAENFSHGIQYLEDHKGSVGNSSQLQKLDQAQQNFNQANTYAEQAAASMNESQMWSRTAAEQRQKSFSAGSNINDQVLSYVAEKKFGGDRTAAAQWQTANPKAYQQEAGSFLESRQSSIRSGGQISRQSVDDYYSASGAKIQSIPTRTQDIEDHINSQSQQLDQQNVAMNKKISEEVIKTQEGLKSHATRIHNDDIHKSFKDKEGQFEESQKEWLITKAGKKMVK